MSTTPNLGEWLDGVLADAPPDLAVRARSALPDGWRGAPLADGVDILAEAAGRELAMILERGCDTRWAAPGLLTVDALVTQACQLLALTGADLDAGSARMVEQLVRLSASVGGSA